MWIGDDETKQHMMKFKIDWLPDGDSDFRRTRLPEDKGKRFASLGLEVIEESKKEEPKNPWAPFKSKAAWTRNQHEADQVEKYMKSEKTSLTEKHQRKTKKTKIKMYSTKVNPSFMLMPGKPHKTHQMSSDGRRTWCGKTLGLTLAKDARMSDDPRVNSVRQGRRTTD